MKIDDEIAKIKYKNDFALIVLGLIRDITFVLGVLIFVGLMLI